MDTKEWIASLKVGDEVVLSAYRTTTVRTVQELATNPRRRGRVLVNGIWFDATGTIWPRPDFLTERKHIAECTPERRQAILDEERREKLFAKIRSIGMGKISTAKLERIAAILDEKDDPAQS